MSRESERKSALPLGPATVEGVEVVTIPLTEYAYLLAARRRLAELDLAGRPASRRRPRRPRLPAPPKSPIDADPEICAFLAARLGKMTQKDIFAACVAEFGPRAPSKSAINRFFQRHWTPEPPVS
jgi:hypothetical protein